MSTFGLLVTGLVLLVAVWATISLWVLAGHWLFGVRARRRIRDEATLRRDGADTPPRLSGRRLRAVALGTDGAASAAAARILVARTGRRLLSRVASPRRGPTARGDALRLLAQAGHPFTITLLRSALAERDATLSAAVVSIAAGLQSPAADVLLLDVLVYGTHPRSRTATELEPRAGRLRAELLALADDPEPALRFWSLTLLARIPHAGAAVAEAAVRRTGDADPSVRAAAVEALARSEYPLAAPALHRLLTDDVFFVRAHAARALATCAPESCAGELVPLLADENWWVRAAAKESLADLGEAAREAVVGALGHPDRFARDGAAEIVLNSGLAAALVSASRAGDAGASAAVKLLAGRSAAVLEASAQAAEGSQPPSAAVAG